MKALKCLLPAFLFACFLYSNTIRAQSFKVVFEKVYLHTDKEYYASGDDLWFKAYLFDAKTDSLSGNSNTVYVELISPDSRLLERKVIRIDNGLGNGDFKLVDGLAEGSYTIRAFTNWMRNFGDNFIFQKEIRVVTSSLNSPGIVATQSSETSKEPLQAAERLRFFPEGGSLIMDVQGLVAFKAEDENGHGVAFNGYIRTSTGERITDISSTDGFGTFLLTPSKSVKYYAEVTFRSGKKVVAEVPAALPGGLSMHVQSKDSVILINLGTNRRSFLEYQNKELLLTARSKGVVVFRTVLNLTSPNQTFRIPRTNMPAGIIALRVQDPQGKPQCERLVYVEREKRLHLEVFADKLVLKPGRKVTLTFKAATPAGEPASANFSVAVVDAGAVPENQLNLLSYMDLKSELRGKIENLSQYFDEHNPQRKAQLDLLLLTQGWRDFIWRRLADTTLKISYLPERGLTISGRLKHVWTNKPVPNANLTLTAWKAIGNKIFTTQSDLNGRFFFDGINFYGNQQFVITSRDEKGKRTGFIAIDTALQMYYPFNRKVSDWDPGISNFTNEIARRASELKRFRLKDTIELKTVTISKYSAGRKLSDSIFVIARKDYQFKYLKDYLLEKIPGAQPHPEKLGQVVFYGLNSNMVYCPRFPIFSTEPPGSKRIDPQDYNFNSQSHDYLNIPVDKVISIQLVHFRNRDGILTRMDGVLGDYFDIHLKLKPGAFDRQGFQDIDFDMDGYYNARTFYAPVKDDFVGKKDLRTTLFWQPDVNTNDKGEARISFYNNDLITKVRVVAEGMSSEGLPVSGNFEYEVR